MKLVTVVGARPQFVKAAVVSRRLRERPAAGITESIVHTGQHYDDPMSGAFFRELDIPRPERNLEVGSGTHAQQTAAMMEGLERALEELDPDVVLVYGDTNSTLATALVAAKAALPLAHVEAGLRSFRRGMAEEVNRVVTDRLADLLFTPTANASEQLRREGRSAGIHEVGDVMLDSFLHVRQRVDPERAALERGLEPRRFVLVTIHRAETTDDAGRLRSVVRGLSDVSSDVPLLVPLHPRTREAMASRGIEPPPSWNVVEPLPYDEMLAVLCAAAAVATDSGGVQKEAYFAAVPCVTLREETEWIETVDAGWNRLAGTDAATIHAAVADALQADRRRPRPPVYGDGNAADRIIDVLAELP